MADPLSDAEVMDLLLAMEAELISETDAMQIQVNQYENSLSPLELEQATPDPIDTSSNQLCVYYSSSTPDLFSSFEIFAFSKVCVLFACAILLSRTSRDFPVYAERNLTYR